MPTYDVRMSIKRTGEGRWPRREAVRLTIEAPDGLQAIGHANKMMSLIVAQRERGETER